jgi:molybdate-binding protein
MPITRYQPGQVQQQGAPLVQRSEQGAQSGVGDAMVGLGRTIQKEGQTFTRIGIEQVKLIEERKDKAAAKEAFAKFGDTLRGVNTEYKALKRRDAIGSTTKAQKR